MSVAFPTVPACRFCELEHFEEPLHADAMAVAVPSVGAFVPGWTLVFPRRHVPALADLTTEEWSAFRRSTEAVTRRLESVFGATVWFEHGASEFRAAAGCGVDHAHLHIVPIRRNLRELVGQLGSEVGNFEWLTLEGQPWRRPHEDYIALGDSTGVWIAHTPGQPSQVVRRALASSLGIEVWDWKRDRRQSNVDSTYIALSA